MNKIKPEDFKFHSNQKIVINKGFFKGYEDNIKGYKIKRPHFFGFFGKPIIFYQIEIYRYGTYYFSADDLDAVK